MRTENSIINAGVGLIGQIISSIMNFICRTVFVYTLSAQYLGINGLFTNILSMLSLAELGIGGAITFSMYKPIADGDETVLRQLLNFYGKVYRCVGIVIGCIGVAITPFLGFFIKDMPDIPHLRFIYILYLVNSVISYFYSYKCSVLDANQKQYIGNIFRYKYIIICDIIQMVFLVLTHNFIVYLMLAVFNTIYTNMRISRKTEELYPWIKRISKSDQLNVKLKSEISKNVFAMFNHNIGNVIVNGTDNILISKFAGLINVGVYSNYSMIVLTITSLISKISDSFTASVGNLGVMEDEDRVYKVYQIINFVNFWIYSFCTICFLLLFQPFITVWLGTNYLLTDASVFMICVNFYISGMRKVNLTFRDAMGLFWHDRYKPLVESTINLAASIYLAQRMGIVGVFIGTFISTILTAFWVEPFILYKHKLHRKLRGYMVRYAGYTGCMIGVGIIINSILRQFEVTGWIEIIISVFVCVIGINVIYFIIFWRTSEFQYLLKMVLPVVKKTLVKIKDGGEKNV